MAGNKKALDSRASSMLEATVGLQPRLMVLQGLAFDLLVRSRAAIARDR